MSQTLYHYTEYIAFDGIINQGIIRLNNILNMNDASEMHFFIEAIKSAIIKMAQDAGNEEIGDRISAFISNEMEEDFYYSAYAACFSKYRDDASQWDRYGNNGHGVCIGFDKECLTKLMGGSVSLQEVIYESEPSNNPLVKELYEAASKETYDADSIKSIMDRVWIQSSVYKHPSFASENEVRLVVSPFIADEFAVAPQYNIAKNRIKKYYPLDIREMCKRNNIRVHELITEIIIGPTSSQSKAILADYLKDCGLGDLIPTIQMSSCPLRAPGL